MDNRSQLRAFDDVPPKFTTRTSGVNGCPLSSSLSNFGIEIVMAIVRSIFTQADPSGFEYADDVVPLNEDSS